MKTRAPIIGILIVAIATLPACRVRQRDCMIDHELSHYVQAATDIEYPLDAPPMVRSACSPAAFRIADYERAEFWDLSLQEAVQLALANSPVLRDLGGTVLRLPSGADFINTVYGPALVETDPRFGVEAALRAFDTNLNTRILAEQNDQRLNNQFLGNLGFLQQNYGVLETELKKRAATGSQFILRENVEFDKNSSLGNEYPGGAWSVFVEGELRHPLLQGAGLPFNRIAGPDGAPGAFNGVLIARVKTDLKLGEFEIAVRDFVANVENAYWDLYFAYRDLDAKIAARDAALETWRRIQALAQTGRRGGEAEKEAQARWQYFGFKREVDNALVGGGGGEGGGGALIEATKAHNDALEGLGGVFRGAPGVIVSENRLRYMMGLPVPGVRFSEMDGTPVPELIRPAEEPPMTEVVFDGSYASGEALFRRPELRREKWEVKRREMELLASRNLLLPNLDLVGRYRFRGFGDSLINSYRNAGKADGEFDNAYQSLTSGDFQEWQLGFEVSVPLGFRQAHTAVRHAELQLARSRAVLKDQEEHILHDLDAAITEVERAYTDMLNTYNLLHAAKDQLDAVKAAFEADKVEFYVVLDSQRRLAETESQYYRAKVEYALALRNVHFAKGTLLEYCGVRLSEGPWPYEALVDAVNREHRRGRPHAVRATRRNPPIVSQGSYPQETLSDPYGDAETDFDPAYDDPYEPVPAAPADQAPLPPPRHLPQDATPRSETQSDITPYAELTKKLQRLVANPRGAASIPSTEENDVRAWPADQMHRTAAAPPLRPRGSRQSRPGPHFSRRARGEFTSPTRPGAAPRIASVAPRGQDDGWLPADARAAATTAPRGQDLDSLPDRPDVRFTRESANPVNVAVPRAPWAASLLEPVSPTSDQLTPTESGAAGRGQIPGVAPRFAPENESQRVTLAGKWVPTDERAGYPAANPPGAPPPTAATPSVRLLPERRAERFAPRQPSDAQVRFLPHESPRRLPPVAETGTGSQFTR